MELGHAHLLSLLQREALRQVPAVPLEVTGGVLHVQLASDQPQVQRLRQMQGLRDVLPQQQGRHQFQRDLL